MKVVRDRQSLQLRASAAEWLARLRSEKRTLQDEAAFQEWLAADIAHARAFELINSVWDAAGPVGHDRRGKVPSASRRIDRRAVFGGVAVAAGLSGTLLLLETAQAKVYRTEIGEQKHVILQDGSALFLDTDTSITVTFDAKDRKAALGYGCANFRLVADSSRPFSIDVGGNKVVCNQSTFDVRRDADAASIVVFQGQAVLESVQSNAVASQVLKSGERLTVTNASVKLDKPDLLPLQAWQTGQAIFRDVTLAAAVREMNRYSKQRLEISDTGIAGLKVSGVYRVGDNLKFALALESLLSIRILPLGDRIELSSDDRGGKKI